MPLNATTRISSSLDIFDRYDGALRLRAKRLHVFNFINFINYHTRDITRAHNLDLCERIGETAPQERSERSPPGISHNLLFTILLITVS